MNNLSVVILAAGEGTRMKSARPKVLHPLAGKPMLDYLLESALVLKPKNIVVVIGHQAKAVENFLQSREPRTDPHQADREPNIFSVIQKQQLGSGEALRKAEKPLSNFSGDVLVLCGDTPLLRTSTLKNLINFHRREKNILTVLCVEKIDPFGYGRILRSEDGRFIGIIEEKDASPEQRQVKEVNTGVYCFQSRSLWPALRKIKADNLKKEHYLTDAVAILLEDGKKVESFLTSDELETLGINNRRDLATAEAIIQQRLLTDLMLSGVTIVKPETVYIERDISIGPDTVILPGSMLLGKTKIGSACRIGPYSYIEDSAIGNNVEVRASFLYQAEVADSVKIGPYSHLREKSVLKEKARIGNFTEVKKSVIGSGTKVSHLSYVGDAAFGKKINVGAGMITCNYDGKNKHRTIVEDGVFIGSNVNLIAPLKVGKKAVIGAGSTITDDVPPYSLALARSFQIIKKNWTRKRRKRVNG